jgi:hypothetical protein
LQSGYWGVHSSTDIYQGANFPRYQSQDRQSAWYCRASTLLALADKVIE